jgi:peptide-methionine (R)-S-oxide reductase
MTTRRNFLKNAAAFASLVAVSPFFRIRSAKAEKIGKIMKTDDQWKKELSPEQFNVLRQEGTERAFTSPLNDEKRVGIFACAGCGLELFPSKFKYDSGT